MSSRGRSDISNGKPKVIASDTHGRSLEESVE